MTRTGIGRVRCSKRRQLCRLYIPLPFSSTHYSPGEPDSLLVARFRRHISTLTEIVGRFGSPVPHQLHVSPAPLTFLTRTRFPSPVHV